MKMPRLSYESESESATATALKEALLQVEMLQKKLKMSCKCLLKCVYHISMSVMPYVQIGRS